MLLLCKRSGNVPRNSRDNRGNTWHPVQLTRVPLLDRPLYGALDSVLDDVPDGVLYDKLDGLVDSVLDVLVDRLTEMWSRIKQWGWRWSDRRAAQTLSLISHHLIIANTITNAITK